MITIALAILPVFALILGGYLARRMDVLGPQAASELNRFVAYMALPALLFEVTASTPSAQLWQPGLLGSFFIAAMITGGIAITVQRKRGRPFVDAVIDGLNASYSNAVYLGLPVVLVLLGRQSLALASVLGAAAMAGLFIIAVFIIEIVRHAGHHPIALVAKVFRSLMRNPLFVSPVAGALWSVSGLGLPEGVYNFLKLLGSAASPCALVSLGLFLALPSTDTYVPRRFTVPWLATMKLVVQPGLAALLAFTVFDLPRDVAMLAVLVSALPTGTGPSMVAALYHRDMKVISATVALTTFTGILTVSLCAKLMGISL